MIPATLIYLILIASFLAYYVCYYTSGAPVCWKAPTWWGMVASIVPILFYTFCDLLAPSVTVSWIMCGIALLCAAGAVAANRRRGTRRSVSTNL